MASYRTSITALFRDSLTVLGVLFGVAANVLALLVASLGSLLAAVLVEGLSRVTQFAVGVGLPTEAIGGAVGFVLSLVAFLGTPALFARALVGVDRWGVRGRLSGPAAAAYLAVPLLVVGVVLRRAVSLGDYSVLVVALGLFAGVSLLGRTHRLARHNGFDTRVLAGAVGVAYFALTLFATVVLYAGAFVVVAAPETASLPLPPGVVSRELVLAGFLAPGAAVLPVALAVGARRWGDDAAWEDGDAGGEAPAGAEGTSSADAGTDPAPDQSPPGDRESRSGTGPDGAGAGTPAGRAGARAGGERSRGDRDSAPTDREPAPDRGSTPGRDRDRPRGRGRRDSPPSGAARDGPPPEDQSAPTDTEVFDPVTETDTEVFDPTTDAGGASTAGGDGDSDRRPGGEAVDRSGPGGADDGADGGVDDGDPADDGE